MRKKICILQNLYQATAVNYDIQLLLLQYQSPPMFLFSLPLPSFLLATDNKKPQINEIFTNLLRQEKKKKNPWMLFNNYCYDLVTEILRSVPVQVKWPIFSCQSSSSFSTPCPFLSCMGAAPHQCNDSFRIP